MTRIALLVLPLAFAGGFAGMAMLAPPADDAPAAPSQAEPAAASPAPPAIAAAEPASTSAAMEAAPVRDVTPAGFTRGPKVDGPLKRVAADPKPVRPKPPPKPRIALIHRPVFAAAGQFTRDGATVRLAGIAAPAAGEKCGSGGDAWPCGRMALAALRRYLRGRTIECPVPAGENGLPATARCSVGGHDLGEWLVALGWAKAEDSAYGEAEAAARRAGLGLWSATRPGLQPQPGPSASAPDSALAISARVSGTP